MKKMPALFVGHGSPMNVIAHNAYTEALGALGASLPAPRGILVVSAHWVTPGLRVTSSPSPRQIYDFFGFPDELYGIRYEAPGSPELAARTSGLLARAGFPCAQDPNRGIDHAAWAVLLHMYPKADIPVIEMSLDYKMKSGHWFEMGAALAVLREEGILVLGSGNIVHNLYRFEAATDAKPFPWALKFNDAVKAAVAGDDREKLALFALPVEESRDAVPTPEHYLPLLPVLGTIGEGEKASIFHESIQNASIAMTGFMIG
ncbi:MAG TPA: 4,5-DOPA dioxygenase extradiol [Rectinemataceae bacterium]|nr:4,5-DOPA dioxygenase extradiol [Rectinemataceae bacterium]